MKRVISKEISAPGMVVLLSIFTIFLLFSCTKISNGSDAAPVITEAAGAAKEWYYGSFKQSAAYKRSAETDKKIPDWEHSTVYKTGNTEIVEFPLIKANSRMSVPSAIGSTEDKKRIADASLCRVSFIRSSGKMTVREVDYIPDLDYLKAKHYDISDIALGKPGNDFSGRVIIKDWNGTPLSFTVFSNGKITRKGKIKTGAPATLTSSLTSESCTAYEICEYFRDCEIREVGDGWYMEFCSEWQPTYVCWIEEYCVPDGSDPCEGLSTEQCVCQLYGYCGGDDGTVPLPTPCEYTSQEAQEILDNITEEISDEVSYEAGPITIDANGVEERPYTYRWMFVKYYLFLGYEPQWSAIFNGVVYRNNPSQPWKWKSIVFDKLVRENLIPPCFTLDMNATIAAPIIQPDKTLALTSAHWNLKVSMGIGGNNVEVRQKIGDIPSQYLQAN